MNEITPDTDSALHECTSLISHPHSNETWKGLQRSPDTTNPLMKASLSQHPDQASNLCSESGELLLI